VEGGGTSLREIKGFRTCLKSERTRHDYVQGEGTCWGKKMGGEKTLIDCNGVSLKKTTTGWGKEGMQGYYVGVSTKLVQRGLTRPSKNFRRKQGTRKANGGQRARATGKILICKREGRYQTGKIRSVGREEGRNRVRCEASKGTHLGNATRQSSLAEMGGDHSTENIKPKGT